MSQTGYQSFEDLIVWKKARELKNELFQLANAFPPEEKYRLTDQLVRSSRSINAQIAEGHGKRTNKDKIRYCTRARGPMSETINHLIDAFDCGYISTEQLKRYRIKFDELERILSGYIKYYEAFRESDI